MAHALLGVLGGLASGKAPPLLGNLASVASHQAWTTLSKGASEESVAAANRVLFGRLGANLLGGASGGGGPSGSSFRGTWVFSS